MPKLNEFLFGSKDKAKKFQNLTPEQMSLLNQVMQALTGQGGDQNPFSQMFGEFNPEQTADVFQRGVADPAMRNFRQRIIPQIQQSFADQGASSGLNNSLATAGRDLEENLSSQLANFIYGAQQQQNQNRFQGLNLGLNTQTFQPYIQQGSAGLVPSTLQAFAGGAGKSFGTAFGNSFF
jgi:hypothetical protein